MQKTVEVQNNINFLAVHSAAMSYLELAKACGQFLLIYFISI